MSLTVLLLVLVSAALHASWNLALKGIADAAAKEALSWWALVVGALLALPLLVLGGQIPAIAWVYALASGIVQVAYFLMLVRAYERADLSVAYPIARGAAPTLIALWAGLVLDEWPGPLGLLGLVLVLAGVLVVALAGLRRRGADGRIGAGVPAALGVAVSISVYSTIDGAAVRIAPPLPYTVLACALPAALMAPVVFARHGRAAVVDYGRRHARRALVVGALMSGAYALALAAYAAAPLGYVGALREVSVVFGALAGWLWRGEGFGPARTAGSVLIFLGILAVAVVGL